MSGLSIWAWGLPVLLLMGFGGWVVSYQKTNVSIADSLWSLFFLLATIVYAALGASTSGPKTWLLWLLLTVWAVRLSAHITWRNWGEDEDRRYRQIRENFAPHFPMTSLFIVFWLQATLAWIISLPLLSVMISPATQITLLDVIGIAIWLTGMVFEAGGDYQLAKFKANPANQGKVMDQGLWRYTRHPNYFGDCCVWWGFYIIALSSGGWWSIISPALMTWLLLRVSGVTLLEKDISQRRPEYQRYIEHTNAFFPGPRSE